jgi:hypothetical protein
MLLRRPVKDWLMGADWMTRSLANCECEGGAMVRPGGGPFLRDVLGVLAAPPYGLMSCWRPASSSPGPVLPPCLLRASMICLCLSRTSKLLCSCSRIEGSLVWKPGDRQARPMSLRSPFAVKGAGRAVRAPEAWTMLLEVDRSRRRGRWREVVMSGDEGSFLTTILGVGLARDLLDEGRLDNGGRAGGDMEVGLTEEEGWREEEE